MKRCRKACIEKDAGGWEAVGERLRRKVMAWINRIMLVKMKFQDGAVGAVHQHPHTQESYVEAGTSKWK